MPKFSLFPQTFSQRNHTQFVLFLEVKKFTVSQLDLGGISTSMGRQSAVLQELMIVVKNMLRNAEMGVLSFMMLCPRFVHQKLVPDINPIAPAQASGTTAPSGAGQPAASPIVQVTDFYSGIPKKPSPFMQQTVVRFERYLGKCRQLIEELEQLLLSDSDRNSISYNS